MTKTFPEVISGIRTAKKGVEVREDIAQMGEYVERFASTATTKASEAERSAERAKNALDGIDQQKADAVKAVQQAQATATAAVTTKQSEAVQAVETAKTSAVKAVDDERDGALRQVASSTEAAQTAAAEAKASERAAEKSEEAAAASASTIGTKADEASTSAAQADASQKKAAKNQQAAEDAANRAAAIVSTDKSLSVDGAPADAKAVGDIILDRTKDTPQPIFYSKAEVEAKIKEILAAQREEDLARIKFWASNDPTSPASFIGGTWERIEGRFIMGASDTYPAGSTGGSATKTIAKTNLPNESIGVETLITKGSEGDAFDVVSITYEHSDGSGNFSHTGKTYPLGDGTPLNILPPYYSMYIWHRVA
nr:MAG TPA: baseplate protein [Caudoviricetes sp.]